MRPEFLPRMTNALARLPQGSPDVRPDPSQWRNLPGYGLISSLQQMQTSNPNFFSQIIGSPMAQHFGITADNLGTIQSREQARAEAFGRQWNPPGSNALLPPAQGLPTPVGQTPVASSAPKPPPPNYQLPSY